MDILLDARDWRTEADLIKAVIAGMQGPTWHGPNYNALYDSMVIGAINALEPPYDFVIRMSSSPTPEVEDAVRYFMSRIEVWRAEGAQLSVRLT